MGGTHRYILESYSGSKSRYTCPACGKKQKFTRYIDTHSGEYVGEAYGKCDRLMKCGYHQRPVYTKGSASTKSNNPLLQSSSYSYRKQHSVNKVQKPSYIPKEHFLNHILIHLSYQEQLVRNPFLHYLHTLFNRHGEGEAIVSELVKQYYIGTAEGQKTIFFQLDQCNKVRTGKVMSYDVTTGCLLYTSPSPRDA